MTDLDKLVGHSFRVAAEACLERAKSEEVAAKTAASADPANPKRIESRLYAQNKRRAAEQVLLAITDINL